MSVIPDLRPLDLFIFQILGQINRDPIWGIKVVAVIKSWVYYEYLNKCNQCHIQGNKQILCTFIF